MKVLDFLDKMNTKKSIKTQRLIDLKGYYTCMYRAAMVKMYDACYISDPTRYDEKEIRSNIVDLDIKSMFDISGILVVDSRQIQYAIYKNKGNEVVLKFLELLKDVIKYKEYCSDINHLYDSCGFSESNRCSVSLGLRTRGAMIEARTDFGISRAIIACFLKPDETAVEMSFNEKLWELAMGILEIPKEKWKIDGILDKDLSHEEEVDCIELLLNGLVLSSGIYSEKLQSWLYEHKWKSKSMTTVCKGLYDFLFSSYSSEVFGIESDVLNTSGKEILAVQRGTYYTKKKISTYNIPIGVFTVIGNLDKTLFDGSAMNGYTGEVYSVDYLESEGISYVGCPIELYITPRESVLFYDIEQTEIKSDTWFKSEGGDIYFCDGLRDGYFKRNCYSVESLEYRLYEIYKNSYIGELVGKLSDIEGLEKSKKYIMRYIG